MKPGTLRIGAPLNGLIEPTDQPEERSYPKKVLKMRLGSSVALPWAIVRYCLNGTRFSVASVYEHAELVDEGFRGWEYAARECGKQEGGMRLWIREGFFLPCRENAAKALMRIPELFLEALAESAGFVDLRELVNAVNSLPSGSDSENFVDRSHS
jgi:hypothetical protein